MKLKTFTDADKANDFIQSVVLLDDGSVQVLPEGTIVVFYKETKENYKASFVEQMLESLERNKFHEEVRKAALDLEVAEYKQSGGKSDAFSDAIKRQKEANGNIQMFEAKIKGLKEWKASNT